jgi:stage V sporulation protein AD
MSVTKTGTHSFRPKQLPVISAWASIAGKKEGEGPLKALFDVASEDTMFGEDSWEKAENRMQQMALDALLQKAGIRSKDLDVVFSGDLLNQCIGSSFSLRNTGLPHIGLYGACSTMAESMLLGTLAVGSGFARRVAAMTSSHFAASERQYRFPLGYGGQRTPTAQWTVTGSGAVLITNGGNGPRIEGCTIGTVVDLGVKDAANMGAAMAPAAKDTILTHLKDFNRTPKDYDIIITGDLGKIGKALLAKLSDDAGCDLTSVLEDCGCLIYSNEQDTHAGGSGCGCSAITLCSKLLPELKSGQIKRLLFCGTGALLSPTSTQQGQPIPGICHAVSICSPEV